MKAGWVALAVVGGIVGVGAFFLTEGSPPAAVASQRDPAAAPAATTRVRANAATTATPGAAASAPVAASPATGPGTAPSVAAPAVDPVVASFAGQPVTSGAADARVPPIDPPSPDEPERAQPWEVADPALYRAREQRLAHETDTRFVQAAAARLPQLRAAVDEMRARGASPTDIARAEDKIQHMQAVQDALLRGEPLAGSAPMPPTPPTAPTPTPPTPTPTPGRP